MSAEWWADPPDQRRRSSSCGHTMLAEDLPDVSAGFESAVFTCPTCGDSQSGQDLAVLDWIVVRDGVPHSSSSWGESRCRLRVKLGDRRRGQGTVPNIEALLKRMSSPGATHIALPPRPLTVKPGLLQHGPANTLVLRATPTGCIITRGEVKLPEGSVLLLCGRGASFRGVSFFGGNIVCCGDTLSASFQQCFFSNCVLYAVHGAAVTLRRCSFRHCNLSIVASGAGTTLHAQACTFEGSFNGFTAEHGAAVIAAQCLIDCLKHVYVFGPSSRVTLDRCELVTSTITALHRYGVLVTDGAVCMRHCNVKTVQQSIAVLGSAALEVHQSKLETSCDISTMTVEGHVWALIRQSDVLLTVPQDRDSAVCCALSVAGKSGGKLGPRVIAEQCSVVSKADKALGVLVSDGSIQSRKSGATEADAPAEDARAVLRGCAVHSARSAGCGAAGAGGRLIVDGGRVMSGSHACSALEGGAAAVRNALLEGLCSEQGGPESVVMVGEESSIAISRCTIRRGCIGVQVRGGRAVVRQTEVSDLINGDLYEKRPGNLLATEWRRGHGFVVHGGELRVVGGVVRGCVFGAGLYTRYDLRDRPRLASFDGLLFDENETAVFADLHAAFRASRCDFRVRQCGHESVPATPEEAESAAKDDQWTAVFVQRTARGATLQDCSFVGYDCDISSFMPHPIQVMGCAFRGFCVGIARLKLLQQGHGVIQDCTFASAATAVSIDGDAAETIVRGCIFYADVEIGVDVEGACRALVAACSFSCSQGSVVAETGATVSVQDCTCRSATGIAAVDAAAVDVLRTTFDCVDSGIEVHTDTVTRISATDCKLEARSTAVWLCVGAEAVLAGCSFASCEAGVHAPPGSTAQIRDTDLTDCATGIDVGAPNARDVDEEKCEVCGREGPAALKAAAWSAASGRRVGDIGPARCVHQGAVADVALTDVRLVRCKTGLNVDRAGRVTAKNVAAIDCDTAVKVVRVGHVSSFEGCNAVGATGPAVRAWRQLGPEEGFRLEEEGIADIVVS